MTYEEAVFHEDMNTPVTCNGAKYYVIGHNDLNQTVTIRELSGNPMFTVPVDVKPEELEK